MSHPDHPPAESFFPERHDLTAFARAVQKCRACPLYEDAEQAVFGEGPADAEVMLVGEMPGDNEDKEGHPFVGSSGQLLDELLVEAGVDREQVYVTNAVKHFKFEERGKRRIHQTPTLTEVRACFPWFEEEVKLVAPKLIVCLGSTAAKAVIGRDVRIRRDHGELFDVELGGNGDGDGPALQVLPTYHPSAALRAPSHVRGDVREALREDLAVVAKHLG